MKILWHSVAPWAPTGYGQQTALFGPRIAALPNVELAFSAQWGLQGRALQWEGGLRVYPGEDYGNRTLPMWVEAFGAGEPVKVITLYDVFKYDAAVFKELDVACWTPIDHKPVPPLVKKFFRESGARPIAMSRFGERELRDAGFDPLYVPHGVDTAIFKPGLRSEFRESYGIREDAFVVGMVANNQGVAPSRKSFPQAFIAFSELRRQHPDAILYLHTEITGFRGGLNLAALCEEFQIPFEAVRFTPQTPMEEGIAPSAMAPMYSAFDVLLNPSYGEGFGIPIVEAQACGVPVIVTDWTAMPELCGAGWIVGGEPWWDAQHAFWMCPSVSEILAALESAYEARGDQALRDGAREFALAYDADRVMQEFWVPALASLDAPREVPPLPNRAMRRAKKAKVTA